MKTLLAILLVLLVATLILPADDGPPKLPVESQQKIDSRHSDKVATTIGKAERTVQAKREAMTVKPEPPAVAPAPYEHPEAKRVRLQVEWNLAHPPRADRVAAASRNPARPALLSPKASGEMRNRKMKPVLESTSDARQTQWP